MLDTVRAEFPILRRKLAGDAALTYLDSGATSQRPQRVLEAMANFDANINSAVHRGAHQLAAQATVAYEEARAAVAQFAGATAEQIVWTKNASEALNVVALALSDASAGLSADDRAPDPRLVLRPGDTVVVSEAEHHSNLVPWQQLCRRTGAHLRWIGVREDGRLDESTFDVIDERTRVVAVTGASNVTGAVTDVAEIVRRARSLGGARVRTADGEERAQSERGPIVVIDACQLAPHLPMHLADWDVDAAAFSSHKMYGPTGVGVLYGHLDLLAALPPVLTGGSMVDTVTMESTTFMPAPARFEAGSQPITQIVGLHAAADFLTEVGMETVQQHEDRLAARLLEQIAQVPHVRVLGPLEAVDRLAVVSFDVAGVHPHDVGQVLDSTGVAVRVGHHCAQPLHRRLGVHASTRASVGVYTTEADIDQFIAGLRTVREFFGLGE